MKSAISATELLESMANRENYHGSGIVHPNVGTYNAVMASWALVPGIEGQQGVNDTFSLLETASLGDDHDSDECPIHPNKETFKILIAVNSKVEDRFSFEQAKLHLYRIQRLSDSICGKVLIPDTDIYNAALSSLLSKKKKKKSDFHSEVVVDNDNNQKYAKSWEDGWLRYGHQYHGGFKSMNKSSITEATDMAKWLLHAEKRGVNPNVEMYEAVIQAWIETGTKEGLLTAEEWAKRAVTSSSPTRLKTFHPIIAAWALSQFERAPHRVTEWNRQLVAMSASKPHLKPDLNFLSAQIIAWKNVQAGIMTRLGERKELSSSEDDLTSETVDSDNESKIRRDVETIFASAQSCKQLLEKFYPNELNSTQDTNALKAFTSMFTHTIQAWGCASRVTLLYPTSSVLLDTSHGVDEMLKIARLFDDKLGADESEEEHAQHMLRLVGTSYAEIASQLYQIDSDVDSDAETRYESSISGRTIFLEKFSHIERMLRDYDFYSRKQFSQGMFTPESKSVRHRLYKEVLQGCAGVTLPADCGHVVRVCKLIMDNLSWQEEQCQDGVQEDITEIFVDMALLAGTVVKVPDERMYVLTAIHNNASRFFKRKKSFETSSYATVDRAALVGAMRMAMGDSELTEPFLRHFDKRPTKQKARGNTAMAFVEEMMR